MDWISWLSRTSLDPSLICEYGLAFSHNELEREDIAYFNHEFLQSMGISIAKHRLEILKLAKMEKKKLSSSPRNLSRILFAIKKTKKSLADCIRTWIHRQESSSRALVVVPKSDGSGGKRRFGNKWSGGTLKRKKMSIMPNSSYNYNNSSVKQERLLLTNGSPYEVSVSKHRADSFSSRRVFDYHFKDEKVDPVDDGYWGSTGLQVIRWDSMFQDLKPT